MKDIKSAETVIHTQMPPNSHTSTGLDDLLVSRTVSQGGYDSDARGIQTPSWTKASAGSVFVSPEYTAKVLNAFDISPSKRSASPPRTPGKDVENHHSSADMSRTPSTRTKGRVVLERMQPVEEGGRQIRVRATSTPKKPGTPHRESFSAFLQLRPQESPTDVLRRLSVGLADGTIKLPDTPELKARRVPSIVEAMPEWRLSFAAPKRASSLHRGDHGVRQALKTLSDRVEKVKRDSAASGWAANDKHVSLLSSLDPALLQYISRYGNEEQQAHLHEARDDVASDENNGGALRDACDVDPTSHADTSGLHDNASALTNHIEHKAETSSEGRGERYNAGSEPEKESVHLFDMRISQRLASTTVLPTQSPSSTNLGSNEHYMDRTSHRLGKLDPFPQFIGQTSAEHLRRPSDPRTKRLFEPDSLQDGRKLHPMWKSGMSISSLKPEKLAHSAGASGDDASSIYMSDAGLEDGEVKRITSHRTRSNSRPNPNSFAVAGRQGVLSIPNDQRRNSMGQMISTGRRSKVSMPRSVSDVRGKESKFSEDFDIHKRTMRGTMESEGANTLANESMSMVDFLTTTDPVTDRHERVSEIDLVGVLNQRLRGSIRGQQERKAGRDTITSEATQGSMSNNPLAGDHGAESAFGTINSTDEPTRTSPRGRDECATNMWERALKMAREDPSLESSGRSFGSSFGELRRDQSRIRRFSDSRPFHEHMLENIDVVAARQRRSLSPDAAAWPQAHRESFNLDKHQSRCVEAKKPLTRSTSPARSIKAKNRSLLDIRRFTTAGHHDNNNMAMSSPATASPARDLLAWARFASHTRLERNGAAGDKDSVSARDFSPPTDIDMPSTRNRSKLSLVTQPDNVGVHTPGSWRFLKFGHGRKKSRSMNFAASNLGHTEKEKEKVKKKSSVLTLTLSLAKWKRLYHSHSSDLRRFRAGHRSSISKGGKVEYPELEVVPGYDGGNGGRVRMEELGDFEGAQRKWVREKEKGRERSRRELRVSPEKRKSGDLTVRGRVSEMETKEEEIGDVGDGLAPQNASERSSSSFSETMEERPLTKHRDGTAAAEGGNAWANIYQACVVKDEHPYDQSTASPSAGLLSSDKSTSDRHISSSREAGEDSYVSCSVEMSDNDLPEPHRSTDTDTDLDAGAGQGWDPGERLLAGTGSGTRDRYDRDRNREEVMRRLVASSELRDSTVEFRTQLQEEERRVREELLGRIGV